MSADPTRPVRPGEELDVDALAAFVARALGEPVASLQVTQFPGGYSNLTYLLCLAGPPRRELVLRRPPFGSKVKRAHDMGREFRILDKLCRHARWAPKPLVFSDDKSVLGADFYVMERIDGVIVRGERAEGRTIDEATAHRMSQALLDVMVDLHALEPNQIGLGDLGKPEGYVERQVRGWIGRYADSRSDDIADMDRVAAWLEAHQPPSGPGVVIHNDLKFDNVVFDGPELSRIVGVLDWEMATLGDALMDLGTSLCYWIESGDHPGLKNLAFGPTALPGMLTRRELAERYGERTGRDVSNIVFYYVYGLYKTAVVCQQIYLRYKQGLTEDPRFKGLIQAVGLMAAKAREAIDRGEI